MPRLDARWVEWTTLIYWNGYECTALFACTTSRVYSFPFAVRISLYECACAVCAVHLLRWVRLTPQYSRRPALAAKATHGTLWMKTHKNLTMWYVYLAFETLLNAMCSVTCVGHVWQKNGINHPIIINVITCCCVLLVPIETRAHWVGFNDDDDDGNIILSVHVIVTTATTMVCIGGWIVVRVIYI